SPINVNRFQDLLETHPNWPLVNSVCKGLRVGFWPWAVTLGSNAPAIVDNAVLQGIKSPEHIQFMREQRDEEIRLGHFSDPFTTLLTGMTTI
ncbi:hypothetical protein BYT27DRAFT_7009983, partial [Phlegmacium glaucopus]